MFRLLDRSLRYSGPGVARFLSRPRARALALRSAAEHGERLPVSELPGLLDDASGCTIITDLVGTVLTVGEIERWPSASIPVRVVWSERDRTLPFAGYGAPMLERVPHASSGVLAGCGHVPMIDDPRAVAREILAVTSAVGAAPVRLGSALTVNGGIEGEQVGPSRSRAGESYV